MDFRILGPLEVRDGDRVIALGGTRQRAVLAVLLLHANQVVSSERLIDELWGEEPPKAAAASLRVFVSELRKALEPKRGRRAEGQVLLTRPPGYLLRAERDELDLSRFERLLEEGRQRLVADMPEVAAQTLREALALWRGPALADFAYEPFAQAATARLEELRVTALELRIEADLALGRHSELVGELEALVAEHPLHERLRRQLMLALYRSGRQSEALDTYRQARRALVEELGIEPSPALQELERAILRQDSALDLLVEEPKAGAGVPAAMRSIVLVARDEQSLDALVALAAPLTRRPPRGLILAELAAGDAELSGAADRVHRRRAALIADGVAARAAAFTTSSPGDDIVRLTAEQDADLLLLDASVDSLEGKALPPDLAVVLSGTPCDVGLLVTRDDRPPAIDLAAPVLVPFSGVDHDWVAIELSAWLADAIGVPLRILGAGAIAGRRDASRLLARASLAVQQVAGVAAEPVLVEPGEEGMIEAAEGGGLLVVGLSTRWRQEGVGRARLAVARKARPPTLLVRKGLRPGGLAPPETHTRFTWTLAGAGA
jgi:DNA-binding SARP family transcriptional activator